MGQRLFMLFLLISHAMAGQELVKWGATYHYKTNPYDTIYGFYHFSLQTMSYSQNGNVVWTIDLPQRMQNYEAMALYDRSTDSTGSERKLTETEIDINRFYHQEFLKCPVFIGDKRIAIADRSGFLLLNKQDGTIMDDLPYLSEEDFFRCDQGAFTIKTGRNSCTGTIANGSSFISLCDGKLVHFNEQELFVWNDKNILLARVRYKKALHWVKSNKPLHYRALIKRRDFRVEMEGYVFVK